jgi:hypothetical protein
MSSVYSSIFAKSKFRWSLREDSRFKQMIILQL